MTKTRTLTVSDLEDGSLRECLREHEEGAEHLTIDGIADPDPIDGEPRVRIHGEVEPVCISELSIPEVA